MTAMGGSDGGVRKTNTSTATPSPPMRPSATPPRRMPRRIAARTRANWIQNIRAAGMREASAAINARPAAVSLRSIARGRVSAYRWGGGCPAADAALRWGDRSSWMFCRACAACGLCGPTSMTRFQAAIAFA